MKLYFVPDYDRKYSYNDNYADDNGYNYTNSHFNRNDHIHAHEDFTDFKRYIRSEALRGVGCSEKEYYEYPLIDVPDELTFQFMMLGLQDYDIIVYNYRTQRIFVGTDYWDTSRACAVELKDEEEHNKNRYGMGKVSGSAQHKNRIINFDVFYDDDEDEREEFMQEVDSTTYAEFKAFLLPYMHNEVFKEYMQIANYLQDNGLVIGRETANGETYPQDCDEIYDTRDGNNVHIIYKSQCPVPKEHLSFLFDAYINDHELYKAVESKLKIRKKETLRRYSVDILTKYHEKTGSKWDIKN